MKTLEPACMLEPVGTYLLC